MALLLRRFHRGERRIDLFRVCLWGSTGLLLLLLLALVMDAMFGLPVTGLLVLDGVLIAAMVIVIIAVLVRLWCHRYEPRRLAVELEARLDLQDNRLINAVHLAEKVPSGTSTELRLAAIDRGERTASKVDCSRVFDHRLLHRAMWLVAAMSAISVVFLAILPGLFLAGLPRLLQPNSDHPPFTFLRFEMQTEPARIIYGQSVAIEVGVTGPQLPRYAEVVFVDGVAGARRLLMQPMALPESSWIAEAPMLGDSPSGETATVTEGRYKLFLDRVETSREFYIDTPRGRSKRYVLPVHSVPRFKTLHVAYSYPAYTGWPDGSEPLPFSGIHALEGTEVMLELTSNTALRGGDLELAPDSGLPTRMGLVPNPAEPRRVQGRFRLQHSGRCTVALVGVDGIPSDAPYVFGIQVVPDGGPEILINKPSRWTVVLESWTVDVSITASDDIGVDRIVLYRAVNGWAPVPVELALQHPNENYRLAQAVSRFDLSSLGAVAGDVITYFAVAYDNRPGAAQFSETPVHAIQVVSEQKYLEYERTRYRIDDLAEEWADFQERMGQLESMRNHVFVQMPHLKGQMRLGSPLTETQKRRLVSIEQDLSKYTETATDLFEGLKHRAESVMLYEFERPYKDQLDQLALQLQDQVSRGASLGTALSRLRLEDSPDVHAAIEEGGQRFLDMQEPFSKSATEQRQWMQQQIDMLVGVDELISQGDRIHLIARQQQDVARRMAVLRHQKQLSGGLQRRADALAGEEAALRSELADVRESMQGVIDRSQLQLPRMGHGAQVIYDRIGQLQIDRDLSDAERCADAGEGSSAYLAARSAAQNLDLLLNDCQSMGQGTMDDLDGCFGLSRDLISNALQQMAQGRMPPGMGPHGAGRSGFAGSMAQMAIMGPVSQGRENNGSGHRPGAGKGDRGSGVDSPSEQAGHEVLNPGRTTLHPLGPGASFGVPAKYQLEAEAYFNRLAEESQFEK